MKILISPAKKMRTDTDTLSPQALPAFLPETERLLSALRSLSRQELKQLWRCSDAITDLNVERLARMASDKGAEFITIYAGEGVSDEDAARAAALFETVCPQAEVSALPGGQPVYYYIVAIE
mgnify:CR=1 FL=1